MKVDTAVKLPPAPPSRTPSKTANPSAAVADDPVALSDTARSAASADDSAPVNTSRIAEIKAAIAAGQFRINPEAIADRLISTAQELVRAQRQAG